MKFTNEYNNEINKDYFLVYAQHQGEGGKDEKN